MLGAGHCGVKPAGAVGGCRGLDAVRCRFAAVGRVTDPANMPSANTNAIGLLGLTVSDPPTQT